MDRSKMMGTGSIPRLLLSFSLPAIAGMMVQATYNIVDRIYIGNGIGPMGIAGATVGFPVMLVIMAFGMLIGIGGASALSIALGEDDRDFARRILGNSFTLLIIVSLLLMALGLIFLDPMLKLFGASEQSLPYARDYLSVILLGVLVNQIGFGLNNFIRGEGNPRAAMITMLIGAGINIILDPVFIFVLDMGIRGAAIATVISQLVSSIWVLSYFFGPKSVLSISLAGMRLDRTTVLRICGLGSAPFVMQLTSSVLNMILNNQLQRYGGDLAISSMGIIYSILMFIMMPIFGLNQGSQPLIGYNYGARSFARVRQTIWLAIFAATAITSLGFCLAQLFPSKLIAFFAPGNGDLLAMAVPAMRKFFLMLPIVGFQVVSSNYFQATGQPQKAMILSMSRQVLFLIPLIVFLPSLLGLNGIWFAPPISDFLAAMVTGFFFLRDLALLKKEPLFTEAQNG
ncbi:MATE family efflux transporter [Sediminispirochaeta bajacaliforniensis]|uniref:MATE family efflux transporter n=1 Tax=Sediminispirochaeta bajacaliforniensis TaxID=148 RepID=UPI00036B7301|nr:MATE family efflux transporter [Sediminispirochaeta bajacaliforniensis]